MRPSCSGQAIAAALVLQAIAAALVLIVAPKLRITVKQPLMVNQTMKMIPPQTKTTMMATLMMNQTMMATLMMNHTVKTTPLQTKATVIAVMSYVLNTCSVLAKPVVNSCKLDRVMEPSQLKKNAKHHLLLSLALLVTPQSRAILTLPYAPT